jgi:NADPH2:quinone reductase
MTMRAVVVNEVGGPDVLRVQDLPEPVPGPMQVRVDVAAAGVNFIDIYYRTGRYPLQLPFVVGSEGAGVVSAVGAGVEDVAVGANVAWAMLPGTGYAEQVLVPADRVVPVPAGVDNEMAAAVMLQGLTAHFLTTSTYPIGPGDVVLVHAAAGGVGSLLTQMATAKGARVIATTSTPEKAAIAREAGATGVILYRDADLVTEVRRLTADVGVDVVYDGVGRSTFLAGLDCLRPRGMMVLFGAASGQPEPIEPAILGSKGSLYLTRPTLTNFIAARDELLARADAVLGWVASGKLHVRVGGRYPLADAGRAHDDLESRRTTGKLLVIPGA